jgi:hypothetical protein
VPIESLFTLLEDAMLPRRFDAVLAGCTHRWMWATLCGLLSLSLVYSGAGLATAETVRKDELKKLEDKSEPKKSDEDKELDELIDQMTKNMPGMEESRVKVMREQMRKYLQNMPAEQRKNMITTMRNRGVPGLPGQPVGVPTPPGFGSMIPDARLGARLEAPSQTLSDQLDLPKDQGLVVREVRSGSAADKAGIKPHDILLELNGKTVPNRPDGLRRLMADIKPDAVVEAIVLRKGKKETIKEIKLPEAKETVGGFPAFPGGLPPAIPQPPGGGFPQPPNVGFIPPIPPNGRAVMTTMIRTADHFTLRHQEGSLIITLTGATAEGKAKIKTIHIQDGARNEKYESADKVPEQYQDKVKNLLEMSEKSGTRIDINEK